MHTLSRVLSAMHPCACDCPRPGFLRDIASLCRTRIQSHKRNARCPAACSAVDRGFREECTVATWVSGSPRRTMLRETRYSEAFH